VRLPAHQVALVEQEDEVLVPEVLADVLLQEEAAGAVGVTGVEHLMQDSTGHRGDGKQGGPTGGDGMTRVLCAPISVIVCFSIVSILVRAAGTALTQGRRVDVVIMKVIMHYNI
jgi:hypothetical protein